MSLTDLDRRKKIEATLVRAAAFVRAARRDLGENRAVDLTGLEERVRALYHAAQAAQDEMPEKIKHDISLLQTDLHALSDDLTRCYEASKRDHDAARRQSAVSAYGRTTDDA